MKIIFVLLVSVYIGALALLYTYQRNFIYFPTPEYEHSFKQISVVNQGETIKLIALNEHKENALIYFGGNAEAVVGNAHLFESSFSNMAIYLVNYRGYGGSTGIPTESGLFADSLKIYDEISKNHNNISVAGRSLGSGVATYLASQRNISHTVLITPYDSIVNVARNNFPFFPVSLLLKDRYDSAARINQINSKMLIVSAELDQVIPMSNTQALINEYKGNQLISKVIENTDHNDISNNSAYFQSIHAFLSK